MVKVEESSGPLVNPMTETSFYVSPECVKTSVKQKVKVKKEEGVVKKKNTATEFVNVRKSNFGFKGHKQKGSERISTRGKTPLECAMRLNWRCKEKGWEIPNPKAGFLKDTSRKNQNRKYNNIWEESKGFAGSKSMGGISITARGKTAKQCARRLNLKCRRAGIPHPNPGIGEEKSSKRSVENQTEYTNVRVQGNGFVGEKNYKGVRVNVRSQDALSCAMKLNWKCREKGIPVPNEGVGFQEVGVRASLEMTPRPKSTRVRKRRKIFDL